MNCNPNPLARRERDGQLTLPVSEFCCPCCTGCGAVRFFAQEGRSGVLNTEGMLSEGLSFSETMDSEAEGSTSEALLEGGGDGLVVPESIMEIICNVQMINPHKFKNLCKNL